MYVAMNRFRVAPGHEEEFERAWRERESFLHEVPGFRRFALRRARELDQRILRVQRLDRIATRGTARQVLLNGPKLGLRQMPQQELDESVARWARGIG